ncbi:MAG: gamma-glutamyltransferase [Pseudomonadota bacterium]|nr:gamma-glutamyltransferase [Pseudomonadota bacterium]
MRRSLPLALCLWLLAGCVESEPKAVPWPHGWMATVANPDATAAAAEMLSQGGHAVDAAIAAHAVLGLVEPESSGLGGGGFMLVFDAKAQDLAFLDGREQAPAGARIDMFMENETPMNYVQAWQSGRAVGVPGAVALYKLAHDRYGKLPWGTVFGPAIRLAEEGFTVTAKMAGTLERLAPFARIDENPGAAEYFFPGGKPLTAGATVRNPAYAETLRRVASEGPSAFYTGSIAEAIVASVQAAPLGGTLTLEDMANYEAIPRPVVCGPWRTLSICTATPPSSGAMQIMIPNLYDHRVTEGATQAQRIRAFVEAQRLAYADRDHYFGDPDRVAVPLDGLLNPAYLQHRAQTLGDPAEAATHGDPVAVLGGEALGALGPDTTLELAGTTHFSIVDAEGNAVSSTMTVEGPFGSSRWASGFVLNNEMTDFARVYAPEAPEPANAVRPGARPRSSMSPTMVFDEAGALLMVTGSPGGNSIPAYTAKTILGIQDWGLSVQEAVNFPNIIARGDAVRVETGMAPGAELAVALEAEGFNVQAREGENSGLHVIVVTEAGLEGAADPRREGNVVRGPTP